MQQPDWSAALTRAHDLALAYLTGLPERPVGARADLPSLRAALGGPLPEHPSDPERVIASLAAAADPGIMGTQSGRFFGFVVGGATPAGLAADWLTGAWDQNAGLAALAPAASVVEEIAGEWLAELLGLPAGVSVGFVTGGQMATFTGLAAARHQVLRRAGWDVESDGLVGAPRIQVFVGEQRHDTIDRALRFLGLGRNAIIAVEADDQGRMRPSALARALAEVSGPVIVCAQVGNVNTGAMDPVGELCDISHRAGAWVHVDGAFGLWASASPALRALTAGVQRADSWTVDVHKWLNVPYDSGLSFCAHPEAHRASMGIRASYLMHGHAGERDQLDYNPEFSRRARGFAVYATLRALGRNGIAELVERSCALARRFADAFAAQPEAEVLNEVVLNQVLVRFKARDGDHDRYTRAVIARLQRDGTCWMSGTTWRGAAAMRISVTNWSTDEDDVDRSVAAILRVARVASADIEVDPAHLRAARPGQTR
jgi:glutamate/tyrosine decarboxylase-like PLP-dependent enzyme